MACATQVRQGRRSQVKLCVLLCFSPLAKRASALDSSLPRQNYHASAERGELDRSISVSPGVSPEEELRKGTYEQHNTDTPTVYLLALA